MGLVEAGQVDFDAVDSRVVTGWVTQPDPVPRMWRTWHSGFRSAGYNRTIAARAPLPRGRADSNGSDVEVDVPARVAASGSRRGVARPITGSGSL